MQLELSPEDAAFREEMRTFFTTEVPQEIRDAVAARGELTKEQIVESQRILNAAGLAVPHWPVEWGGQDWTPLQRHIWHEEMQRACVPMPLAFNASHGRPGDRGLRHPGAEGALPAADGEPRHLVVARASPSPTPAPTSPRCAPPRCATATTSWSTARRPGRRSASTPTGSSAWSAPTRTAEEAARHLVPAHRHDHPRRHRAPDRADRRRLRGQRGLLRGRPRAGREPRRRGEPRLGLRQVPARQRAGRRRAGRRDQAGAGPGQGARRRPVEAGRCSTTR